MDRAGRGRVYGAVAVRDIDGNVGQLIGIVGENHVRRVERGLVSRVAQRHGDGHGLARVHGLVRRHRQRVFRLDVFLCHGHRLFCRKVPVFHRHACHTGRQSFAVFNRVIADFLFVPVAVDRHDNHAGSVKALAFCVLRSGGGFGNVDAGQSRLHDAARLPLQHRIAAVDGVGVRLEISAQYSLKSLHLIRCFCFRRRSRRVVRTADALFCGSLQIVDVRNFPRPANGRTYSRTAGLHDRNGPCGVSIRHRGGFHNADETADHIFRGGYRAAIVYVLDRCFLGVAHNAANVRASCRHAAGIVAPGHSAGIQLIAEAADILHTGNISLIAAVGHGAVHHHAGKPADAAGLAGVLIRVHRNAGNNTGEIKIFSVGNNASDVPAVDGIIALGRHTAGNGKVLDDGMRIFCALNAAEEPKIHTLAGCLGCVIHRKISNDMSRAIKGSPEFDRISANRRPVDFGKIYIRRQYRRESVFPAIDLLREPHKLFGRADLVNSALLLRFNRGLYGHPAFRRKAAIRCLYGNDRFAGLSSRNDTILHRRDIRVFGFPCYALIGCVCRAYSRCKLCCLVRKQRYGIFAEFYAIDRRGCFHRNSTFRFGTAANCRNGSGAGF